jgi:hypothetical protein
MPTDVTLVTCATLPEPDPDEGLLVDAITALDATVRVCAWDDPDVDWGTSPLTVLRSTWNYHLHRDAFHAWATATSALTSLRNPLSVVLANTHKSYLAGLERAGVPVVPTRWFTSGGAPASAAQLLDLGWSDVVIKPAVSGGSWATKRFSLPDDVDAACDHLDMLRAGRDAMVQPWASEVEGAGERSLVFLGTTFSHAVRKSLRLDGDHEVVSDVVEAAPEELALAERALASIPGHVRHLLAYARVDMVRSADGTPMLMELELVEPSLFLAQHEPGLEAFAELLVTASRGTY